MVDAESETTDHSGSSNLDEDAASNRQDWNARADEYQHTHGAQLDAGGAAWGVWQIPESDLGILGGVAGRDVLELGSGAARFSIALARRGARAVALDVSERQLEHARRLQAEHSVEFPLVAASGEATGLPDASFDIVFSDHGASTFCDPERLLPEVARLLRPDGLYAFSGMTPFVDVTWAEGLDGPGERLVEDYFGLRRFEGEDGEVFFMRGYADWIRLFSANGFEVLDLTELRPGPDASSTFWNEAGRDWARRWPAEHIWSLRKRR